MKTWMWIVLGILVAVGIGYAAYHFMKPKKAAGLSVSVNNATTPSTAAAAAPTPATTVAA